VFCKSCGRELEADRELEAGRELEPGEGS
jgi:hypothetical protein